MKTKCTHLLFIDADIEFNPDDILNMINADHDIISGVCPKKIVNWERVHHRRLEASPEALRQWSREFNFVTDTPIADINKPFPIKYGGDGYNVYKKGSIR